MTASFLGAVLGLGLAGSWHCPLMCGPLAVAGCRRGDRVATGSLVASLGGRVVSYAALGAAFGAIGEHALCLLPMATVQLVAMVLVGGFAFWRGISALRRPRLLTIRPRAPGRLARGLARLHALLPPPPPP